VLYVGYLKILSVGSYCTLITQHLEMQCIGQLLIQPIVLLKEKLISLYYLKIIIKYTWYIIG